MTLKGGHHTKETIQKISLSKMGHGCSEETRRKIGLSSKGRHWKLSEERKKQISELWKGRKHSDKTKRKMSLSHMGRKHTEESKRKMSIASKSRKHSEETKRKMRLNFLGRKHSDQSKKKMSEAQKGEKSWRWKGGITPIGTKIRFSRKYAEWRMKCFIRDNFTCRICHISGSYLIAHHYKRNKSFSKLLDELRYNLPLLPLFDAAMIYEPMWDVDNGITVCKKCHQKLHKKAIP